MRAVLFLALFLAAAAVPAAGPPRVILVGDSTMAPRTGYGDAFCGLFLWQVDCVNAARGGRSTKSYRADGSWQRALATVGDRDPARLTWVLLQFGHNDQPGKAERSTDLATEYPANLRRFVGEIRAAGAEPVLVTPLVRRRFRDDATHDDDLGPWAEAMRGVARETGTPLVDLHSASARIVSELGPARADALAMAPAPGADFDRTHLGPRGAALFARLVARELQRHVPALASHLVVGAVEPPGRIARPQLSKREAERYSYAAVLGPWDPLAEAQRESDAPDLVVDAAQPGDGRGTFPTIQTAVDAATGRAREGEPRRIRILLRPGTYDEQVLVPASPNSITLYGAGPDAAAVRIRSKPAGGIASAVVRVRSAGFHAKNLTIENAHNKDRGDTRDQMQAVALTLDDADRAHLENVRLLGFQDTLFLSSSNPRAPARAFVDRSYVEGDMDFIFGEATAYFRDTEIRSLGDRAVSYALAPSTHYLAPHGLVFDGCRFTHDGSPNALGGFFKLARQWNRGPSAVGKVAILRSHIGAHIDRERPWADWSIGTPRHRPVQYNSGEHWERLYAAGIDPPRDLGYPAKPATPEPFLAEFENTEGNP